jgi:hypothetical protein
MKSTLRIGSCSGISSAVNVSHNQCTPLLRAPRLAATGRTYLQHIIKHASNATTQQVNLGPPMHLIGCRGLRYSYHH